MAKKRYGEYSKDLIERAKEIFISQQITLPELSRQSEELLGQHITFNAIKKYAGQENWNALRQLPEIGGSTSDQVNHLKDLVYNQIVAESRSGLLIYGEGFDREEIEKRLAGMELKILEIAPKGIDSQLINSFMNLLAKSGIRLDDLGATAKTDLQQVVETVHGELEMNK